MRIEEDVKLTGKRSHTSGNASLNNLTIFSLVFNMNEEDDDEEA